MVQGVTEMTDSAKRLRPVDHVDVTILVDNYVDALLPRDERITPAPLAREGEILADALLAEHGLSLLITVTVDNDGAETHTVLLDTGYSRIALLHNIELLGIDVVRIEAIVLSHGHMDHTGSVEPLLRQLPVPVPVVVHPDAFAGPRFAQRPDGVKVRFPQTLQREGIKRAGARLIETSEPTFLADDTILVSGQIPRTTSFEHGLMAALIERDGELERDTIADDQAVIVSLGDRGVVVISGCAHAGIINTIHRAKGLGGIGLLRAVVGGFHLSGANIETTLTSTINELVAHNPAIIAPMHCTGASATQRIAEALPSAFVTSSVGSTIHIN
jgi:7,8-dihydropterin-6-yl-methyl-4-(beta-D-ribofuranosyl)aminobenzene 5'-phosphate synthase